MVSSKHTASKAHNARKQSCTELGRKLKPTAKHLKQGRKREHPIHSHTHTHTYIQNPLKDKGSQRRAEADDECVYLLDVCAAQNVAVCQALQAGTDTETEPKKSGLVKLLLLFLFACVLARAQSSEWESRGKQRHKGSTDSLTKQTADRQWHTLTKWLLLLFVVVQKEEELLGEWGGVLRGCVPSRQRKVLSLASTLVAAPVKQPWNARWNANSNLLRQLSLPIFADSAFFARIKARKKQTNNVCSGSCPCLCE